MKVLVIENSLDDLLNVKISSDGGKTYTDYSVSSLKNDGLALDCNPSDLKVICDTNILNHIKVFADGEKLTAGSGSGSRIAQKLNVIANGDYHTPDGVYYDPIYVNVPSNTGGITIKSVESGRLTTVGSPVTLSYSYSTGSDSKYVVWVGSSEQIRTRDLVVGQTYNYTISGIGLAYDITLKKRSVGSGIYRIDAKFNDRGSVSNLLECFLVVGTLNKNLKGK